jgi:hypothetical protein
MGGFSPAVTIEVPFSALEVCDRKDQPARFHMFLILGFTSDPEVVFLFVSCECEHVAIILCKG